MSDDRYETDLAKDVQHGSEAGALLASPVVDKVFREVEAKYLSEFKAAKADTDVLRIKARLDALEDVAVSLRATRDRGVLAGQELDRTGRRKAATPKDK